MDILGKCGDNCSYCPRYLATQNGSMVELEKVKELWIRLGLRDPDFPLEKMVCYGCKPENKCAYEYLYKCVSAKSLENCGLCNEYPCYLINSALDESEKFKSHVSKVCTQDEMDMLHKAFFSKKTYFDHIHQNK